MQDVARHEPSRARAGRGLERGLDMAGAWRDGRVAGQVERRTEARRQEGAEARRSRGRGTEAEEQRRRNSEASVSPSASASTAR